MYEEPKIFLMLPTHLIAAHILPHVARHDKTTALNLLFSSREIYDHLCPREMAITLIAVKQDDAQTALMRAVEHDQPEIIEVLLSTFGAKLEQVEDLFLYGDPSVEDIPRISFLTLKTLHAFRCKFVNNRGDCPLLEVATFGDVLCNMNEDMVRFLCTHGANVNQSDGDLLNLAVERAEVEKAIRLYSLGADLDLLDKGCCFLFSDFDSLMGTIKRLIKTPLDAYTEGYVDGYNDKDINSFPSFVVEIKCDSKVFASVSLVHQLDYVTFIFVLGSLLYTFSFSCRTCLHIVNIIEESTTRGSM
jgi:hypothetical protein